MAGGRLWTGAVATAVVAVVAGCGADEPGEAGPEAGDDLTVVTTVAPITDIVREVGGPDLDLVGIVPDGTDSHTFEPDPSVARELADARLFVANGLFLEEPSLQLAEANLPPEAEIITLADQVVTEDEWVFDFSFPQEQGRPNPHLWTNPPLADEYAAIVAAELARVDPDGADGYQRRYQDFSQRLDRLDQLIAEAVATIPPEHRKLVTYHDSFPYFAPRYGFEIIGAIQPADFSEPSAQEVANLIDQIRSAQVPAVFGAEEFPSDVLAQIATETGAEYVADLRDDALPGQPGEVEHSYVGMMLHNVRVMVDALGGDSSALDMFPFPVR